VKPEYEEGVKSRIREFEAWFQADNRSRFERKLVKILDGEPQDTSLVEWLTTLSDRQEFIETCTPKILKHIRDTMGKTPTATEWNRVKKLTSLLEDIEALPGTNMYWLGVEIWAMGKMPERSFFDLASELKEHIEKISALRDKNKKKGRDFEYWQCELVIELEATFRKVLSVEPKRTTNSLLTKIVQAFLQELIDESAFSERRKIVSDIYRDKMDKYT
jgi:hypothetical protein